MHCPVYSNINNEIYTKVQFYNYAYKAKYPVLEIARTKLKCNIFYELQ